MNNKKNLSLEDVRKIKSEVAKKDGLSHQSTITTKGELRIDGKCYGKVKRKRLIPQNYPQK